MFLLRLKRAVSIVDYFPDNVVLDHFI